jgi:hypothetical protein
MANYADHIILLGEYLPMDFLGMEISVKLIVVVF